MDGPAGGGDDSVAPSWETGSAADGEPGKRVQGANSPIDDAEFRRLAEAIPTLCWMADADGYIFWFNQRWHDYCGTTPEEMAGWGWQSVHDPERLPEVVEKWTASIASGDPFELVFPLRGADGVFRPFLTRISPARDTDGWITRWYGVNTDISAQVEAETRLREANEMLQNIAAEREAILGQLGEGVIVTGPDGRIRFVNDAATRLHGVSGLGGSVDDYGEAYSLFAEDGTPHPIDTLPLTRAVRDRETVVDARWRIRRPDGSEVLAIGNARPVKGPGDEPIGAVLTIRDDTQRYATEKALAAALQAKEMLLYEVNHRVTNSLQLVTSVLTLQASKSESPMLRQSLQDACARVAVVARMHRQLYASDQHNRVDLADYLRELAVDTVAALDSGNRLTLTVTCPDAVVLGIDRAMPLAMIVNELLTNVVKYAFVDRAAGTIALSITTTGDTIALLIEDDGCGLPEGFDPSASTGLGMRIIAALTRQLGATLTLPPRARGAAFLLAIPADA
ncbi:MAG: hypothetical protein B7Y45_00755 [Sphingomonas sp. 28-66-16]|nr:MAG: hypothetical protein B7Y45_00755 [Sphingomonas sp. 28-66-16]